MNVYHFNRHLGAALRLLPVLHVRHQVADHAGCVHCRVSDGGLEIGYWVHGDWTERGIATDAVAALTATRTRAARRRPGRDLPLP